jgi:hypothetical protein
LNSNSTGLVHLKVWIFPSKFQQMFDSKEFKSRIQIALENAKNVLETNKSPVLLETIEHSYADKFTVVENLGALALSGIKNALATWELDLDVTRNIMIRCKTEEDCTFVGKETKKIPRGISELTEKSQFTKETKVTETFFVVEEYKWERSFAVSVFLTYGDGEINIGDVFKRKILKEDLKTHSEMNPLRNIEKVKVYVCNITHLFCIDVFSIDRNDESCFTPRNNTQCKELTSVIERLGTFCAEVLSALPKFIAIDTREAILPVPVLNIDQQTIISHHIKRLNSLLGKLDSQSTDSSRTSISQLQFVLQHIYDIGQLFYDGLLYVENF